MLRRAILTAAALFPALAVQAAPPHTHCNFYQIITNLPAPMIAVVSKPYDPDDFEETLHAQEKVCNEVRMKDGVLTAVPGTRTVTWKLSVRERGQTGIHMPPVSVIEMLPWLPTVKP